METDYRAKVENLKAIKKRIRLQPNKFQHLETRKALDHRNTRWLKFVEAWKPGDLILASRINARDRVHELLFQRHREHFPDACMPLLYYPKIVGNRMSTS